MQQNSPARSSKKKARLMMAINSSSNNNNNSNNNHNNINAVFEDDGLVGSILSFLPLSFRFTAAVNRRFQRCYREVHNGNKTTSFQYCVHTRNAAEIWLAENGGHNNATNRSSSSRAQKAARVCNVAAQFGRWGVLEHLKEQGCHWSSETCALAAAGGHLLLLQWMRTRNDRWGRCPWQITTSMAAARHGHLYILQ
jgi:hypothetical protein